MSRSPLKQSQVPWALERKTGAHALVYGKAATCQASEDTTCGPQRQRVQNNLPERGA